VQQAKVDKVFSNPVVQELMRSSVPARFAYNGPDDFPRVVPIGFFWNGRQFLLFTPPNAPKVPALTANSKLALTIDTNAMPPNILLVRGTVTLKQVDGVPDEYIEASRKVVDEAGFAEWEAGVRALYKQMVRITLTPTWAKFIDFKTTLPSAVEELIKEAQVATAK